MPRIQLPAALEGIFFEHYWDTSRIWQLPTLVTASPITDLWWHVDLPIWSTVPGEARFDLAPATVLNAPRSHPAHWERIARVDASYPLELFEQGGRWVIADGYHRLVRHHLDGKGVLPVRKHPAAYWQHVEAVRASASRLPPVS